MNPLARTTDPHTSHEAADRVDMCRSQAALLQYLKKVHPDGFYDREVTDYYDHERTLYGLPKLTPSRLRTARRELVRQGVIVDTGDTAYPDGAGRGHKIWRLA